jgi:mono/diheme cytochrome c family protein
LEPRIEEAAIAGYSKLVRADNKAASLEQRARSYLDANCSQCHRPNGVVSYLDARYDTPLPRQNLVDAAVVIDQGIDGARAIAPNDIWRSIVFMRVNTLEPLKMPPLAHETLDTNAIDLLREWIQSLPGPPTLEPPTMEPKGGEFKSAIKVSLKHSEPGVVIRYTLDGSAPGRNATVYASPIEISGPTTLRAKAFKSGFNRSITVQETFVVGE